LKWPYCNCDGHYVSMATVPPGDRVRQKTTQKNYARTIPHRLLTQALQLSNMGLRIIG